jgi:hypothetical protein
MAIKVKPITLWRREVENKPGALAATLEPLARAGADLRIVMGYREPGGENLSALELYPVSGKKTAAAAGAAGLAASGIPTLLVEGDNRPGLGHAITRAVAEAGININFVVAQTVGRRFGAVFGFENQADAKTAAALIRKAKPPAKK